MRAVLGTINISNIKRITFRHDINGLRAVAVLSVIFYHADIRLFKGGWLGVDIFLIILEEILKYGVMMLTTKMVMFVQIINTFSYFSHSS